jgi:hypothetical protein
MLADRGYFSGPEIRVCDLNDIGAYVPKPLTYALRKKGFLMKTDFVYIEKDDVYRCPADKRAIHRFTTVGHDMNPAGVPTQRLPALSSEGAMFTQRLSPYPTMGARKYTGSHAAPARPEARCNDYPPKYCRSDSPDILDYAASEPVRKEVHRDIATLFSPLRSSR